MGKACSACQQIHEKIIELFKNIVSQREIGRNLHNYPSLEHKIKCSRNLKGISLCKDQGHKPTLDILDLRSLRQQCIKKYSSEAAIIT